MNPSSPLHLLRLQAETEAKAAVIGLFQRGELEDWLSSHSRIGEASQGAAKARQGMARAENARGKGESNE